MLKKITFSKKSPTPSKIDEMFIVVQMTEGKDWELVQLEKSKDEAVKFAKAQVTKATDVFGVFQLVCLTEFKVEVKESCGLFIDHGITLHPYTELK